MTQTRPAAQTVASSTVSEAIPSPAEVEDMTVGEWWSSLTESRFLRIPFWGWVGILGFLVFCTLLTLTLWSYEVWPFSPPDSAAAKQ